MIGNFKANLPYNNFLLLIFGLLIKWSLFLHNPLPIESQQDTFLYRSILHLVLSINNRFSLFIRIIVFILIYVQAILLNRMVVNQKMFLKPNYLTGMTCLLFTSLLSGLFVFNAQLLCATIIVAIFSMLSKLSNSSDPKKILFNTGFIAGIGAFIYFPSLFFIAVIYLSLFTFRPFRLAESVVLFLGLCMPFYFFYSYLYLSNQSFQGLFPKLLFYLPVLKFNRPELISLLFLLIIFFIGIYVLQKNMNRLLVQSRKMWNVIFYFLLISILILFVNNQQESLMTNFFIIPIALISTASFVYIEKKIAYNFLYWVMVLISALVGYYNL